MMDKTMLAEMIRVQWSRVRVPVILVTVLLFSMPLIILRTGGGPQSTGLGDVGSWLRTASIIGRAFPIIALILGLYLGLAAWADDTRGGHVYALTLPISRERYVVYRFIAAGVPILVAVAGLLSGNLVASAVITLPQGVHAYPFALTVRMLIATLVCYAVFFAIGIATRRAVLLVLGVVLGLVAAEVVAGMLDLKVEIIGTVFNLLTTWPGPFAILLGNWALFDV